MTELLSGQRIRHRNSGRTYLVTDRDERGLRIFVRLDGPHHGDETALSAKYMATQCDLIEGETA